MAGANLENPGRFDMPDEAIKDFAVHGRKAFVRDMERVGRPGGGVGKGIVLALVQGGGLGQPCHLVFFPQIDSHHFQAASPQGFRQLSGVGNGRVKVIQREADAPPLQKWKKPTHDGFQTPAIMITETFHGC